MDLIIQPAVEIYGFMGSDELNWLAAAASKSKSIVEIGCFHGRSTRVLADNTPGVVYAVDPWDGKYFKNNGTPDVAVDTNCFDQFLYNLGGHIPSGKVVVLRGYSHELKLNMEADLVFIDGDHRYEAVIRDIEIALRLVKKGIISGHDYDQFYWPGVKKAVDEIFGEQNVKVLNTIWWIENG